MCPRRARSHMWMLRYLKKKKNAGGGANDPIIFCYACDITRHQQRGGGGRRGREVARGLEATGCFCSVLHHSCSRCPPVPKRCDETLTGTFTNISRGACHKAPHPPPRPSPPLFLPLSFFFFLDWGGGGKQLFVRQTATSTRFLPGNELSTHHHPAPSDSSSPQGDGVGRWGSSRQAWTAVDASCLPSNEPRNVTSVCWSPSVQHLHTWSKVDLTADSSAFASFSFFSILALTGRLRPASSHCLPLIQHSNNNLGALNSRFFSTTAV